MPAPVHDQRASYSSSLGSRIRVGRRVPQRVLDIAVPFAEHDLAGHPAWLASIAGLRYAGVRVIDPKSGAVGYADPVESGTRRGSDRSLQLGMGTRSTPLDLRSAVVGGAVTVSTWFNCRLDTDGWLTHLQGGGSFGVRHDRP
jgi:hypothetical protein